MIELDDTNYPTRESIKYIENFTPDEERTYLDLLLELCLAFNIKGSSGYTTECDINTSRMFIPEGADTVLGKKRTKILVL